MSTAPAVGSLGLLGRGAAFVVGQPKALVKLVAQDTVFLDEDEFFDHTTR